MTNTRTRLNISIEPEKRLLGQYEDRVAQLIAEKLEDFRKLKKQAYTYAISITTENVWKSLWQKLEEELRNSAYFNTITTPCMPQKVIEAAPYQELFNQYLEIGF